jgi:shikimate dehydrogenase
VELTGWDVALGAPPKRYRSLVERFRDERENVGALITTHKVGVWEAAHDLLDGADELARLCREVSCLAKRDGRLLGFAKDPQAAGRALERFLPADHFEAGGGHALCFGAGGSGVAIALYLTARRSDRPERTVVTDRSPERLERLRVIAHRAGVGKLVECVPSPHAGVHWRLLSEAPPGSLVVNATGMGKDSPGSPLPEAARFPERGVVWELNYRGELDFLRQARSQAAERDLAVEDGWGYFIHGWTSAIEEVFARPISEPELERLAAEAEFARPARAGRPAAGPIAKEED